jgi:tRNA uridine 5-carboxymethylaminomethyl modification enzyme
MKNIFDIIIVGGGHAGVEAAWISSQFDLNICLISSPGVGLASAPCNPSVGGVGKGQVVREIDSLGGLMGRLTDLSGIQFRTLNESKGFAVQSTRVQIDKELYSQNAEAILLKISNLTIAREMVVAIEKSDEQFCIKTSSDKLFKAKKVIVTAGTFLNGKLHTGEVQTEGGRVDAKKSVSLNELVKNNGLFAGRFKTGTPARIKKESINYSVLEEQPSDADTRNFSVLSDPFLREIEQVNCYLTYTNEKTLTIIRSNKERSPIFNGQISGVGPRYCPSIEDKAFRYTDKNIHHVFIEPEGLSLNTMYPSGVSTSLPKEVQLDFLRTISGLESCEIDTFGYAVEYDVVDTSLLDITLQSKSIPGLYFAGQICGTSGYEEAGGQGLIAGANAALAILSLPRLVLNRDESYIGVMIEDLITSKRDEPYRLFTARSENRLFIREDNTFLRMYPYRSSLMLNNQVDHRLKELMFEYDVLKSLTSSTMYYSTTENKDYFTKMSYGPLDSNISLAELIKRPNLNPVETLISETKRFGASFSYDVIRTVAVGSKYEGYVVRMSAENEKMNKLNAKKLNVELLLDSKNISFECRQRIARFRPETFGQLKNIEGIRPATLAYVAGNIL